MADSTLTYTGTVYIGNKVMRYGIYTNSGTSGDIDTGLNHIDSFSLQSSGSATSPYGSVSGGVISSTTANNDSGYFIAIGS